MNQRLQQFLTAENLSQSQFADILGVARASISHILAGRNKPGFDFIESLARRFPTLNIDWFITGKGKMYKNATENVQGKIFEVEDNAVQDGLFAPDPYEGVIPKSSPSTGFRSPSLIESAALSKGAKDVENKKFITKVTVFFNDGTFKEL